MAVRRWWHAVLVCLALLPVRVVAGTPPAGNVDCTPAVIGTIFGEAPGGCTADANQDGRVSAADVVAALSEASLLGPDVTVITLATADGIPMHPLGEIDGVPVFFRASGFGFAIVVEGEAGMSGLAPGVETFDSNLRDPSQRPDLQIESTQPLGDGSAEVCDGGVPGINPSDFGPSQAVANALNDFACHFVSATAPGFACTKNAFDQFAFVGNGTQVQFCFFIPQPLALPGGETTLNVHLRDTAGNLGPLRSAIVRVGSGPPPPTFTPSSTPTTPALTRTPTRTWTATGSATRVTSPTRSPTLTAGTPTTRRPTLTPTPSPVATHVTASPTTTSTYTLERTPTPSPTAPPTPTGPLGPIVTFLGLTAADDSLVTPSDTGTNGLFTYKWASGTGFSIVVEAKPGANGVAVGRAAYAGAACGSGGVCGQSIATPAGLAAAEQTLLSDFPNLQIEVSQPLGNGSPAVCDTSGPAAGGVPATDPPSFDSVDAIVGALNDLGCRFIDGCGMPCGRSGDSCAKVPPTDDYGFVENDSTIQFCGGPINRFIAFPPGDTLVTVRVSDELGNPGPPAQIVIHVGS